MDRPRSGGGGGKDGRAFRYACARAELRQLKAAGKLDVESTTEKLLTNLLR